MAIGTLVLDVKRAEGRCRTGASAWGDIPKGSELFVKGEAPPPPPPPAPCRPPRSRAPPEFPRAGRWFAPGFRLGAGRGAGRVVPAPGRPAVLAPVAPRPRPARVPRRSPRPRRAPRGWKGPTLELLHRGAGRTAAALGRASTAGGAGGSVRGLVVSARVLWAVGSSICRPWPRRTARARPTLELLLHRGCRSNRSRGVRGPGEGRAPVGRSTESGGARGCLAGLRLDVGQLGRALDRRREEVAQQGSLLLLLLLRGLPISNRRPSGGPRRRRAGARPARPGARRGRCRSRLRQGTLRSLISIPWIALVALSCGAGRGSAPATRPGS